MSEQGKEMSVEEFVSTLRNQIVLGYDQAKEIALRNYDMVTKKYVEALVKLNEANQAKETKSEKSKKE